MFDYDDRDQVCRRCGSTDKVRERINPFDADVYNRINHEMMCENCYRELADDI